MSFREWLPKASFDHPITVLMAFVASLVLGAVAWTRIPLQMMPDGFEPGWLWVWVPYADASPVEVDERIVRPVEAQLATVPGIANLDSRASSGSASFGLEFHNQIDMDEAYNAVVDRLERAMPDLPEDVERYGVWKYNPNDEPVIWAGVSLSDAVDDPHFLMSRVVQPTLERIPGVAALDVWGVPQRGIYIDYDKERTYAHGVDLGDVQRRLATDNFQRSSGRLLERGFVTHVRALSPVDGVDDLRAFPVKGDTVLGDIADVQLRAAYSSSINRIDGQSAAAFAVRKDSSANAVAVGEQVEAALDRLEQDPRTQGASFFVFFSQGRLIEDSVDTLAGSALFGGVMAVAILFAFLREWRMTMLISASIPFSMLMTIGILYFRGASLNLLSLMGLMLAVGMVVDNAIVVVESIYRRRADGEHPRDAAIRGSAEVNLAIVLSTATTMVVFLPVILMSENAALSFFMGELGMPVVYALGASLVVALLFAPLATRYVGASEIKADPRWVVALSDAYARVLSWIGRHRSDSLVALLAMALLTFVVAVPGVQCSASSDGNLNDFTVEFTVPPQADVYERDEIVRALETAVEAHREAWGVTVYRSRLEGTGRSGRLYVYLDEDGPMDRPAVMAAAREALPSDLPGVQVSVGWEGSGDQPSEQQLGLSVWGEDMETLTGIAAEVARRVRSVDGVIGARLDQETEGADEIRLIVDRDAAARYGVSATQIGTLVAYAMRGSTLSKVLEGEKEIGVAARFSLEDRSDLDQLLSFEVWSSTLNALIPVRTVTAVEVGKGPGTLSRRNGRTSTSVTVDLAEEAKSHEVWPQLEAALQDLALPTGYGWSRGGDLDRQGQEDAALQLALLLSVCFVFLLMGILFESWLLPLAIVTTIPMAMMGAMWGLFLTGTDFDTMAAVGMVILVGVVVNNGIVLVDLITQLRGEGWAREAAMVEAGRRRLRPILMTASTTIFGLIPMAIGSSSFVGIPYAPLGRTVIFGMVASTLLTLLFVPFLYALLDDLREASARWFVWVRGVA